MINSPSGKGLAMAILAALVIWVAILFAGHLIN